MTVRSVMNAGRKTLKSVEICQSDSARRATKFVVGWLWLEAEAGVATIPSA